MAAWLEHLAGGESGPLEDLLHPDVVFWSPVIFSPQQGRDLTLMYLTAASQVFPGDPETEESGPSGPSGSARKRSKTAETARKLMKTHGNTRKRPKTFKRPRKRT